MAIRKKVSPAYFKLGTATSKRHIPVVLILDTSFSMKRHANAVRSGLNTFIDSVRSASGLDDSVVELMVICFNGSARVEHDFADIESYDIPTLCDDDFKGTTNIGEAVNLALEKADEKLSFLGSRGIHRGIPIVFLLTDGYTDAGIGASEQQKAEVKAAFDKAIRNIQDRESVYGEKSDRIIFCAGGLNGSGAAADLQQLARLTRRKNQVVSLHGESNQELNYMINQFFRILTFTTCEETYPASFVDSPKHEIMSIQQLIGIINANAKKNRNNRERKWYYS